MAFYAATGAAPMSARGWLVLAALVAAFALSYACSCAWWPFARCLSCKGAGKHSRSDGKVWRTCRRCKGSGSRLRVGRLIYDHFASKGGNAG